MKCDHHEWSAVLPKPIPDDKSLTNKQFTNLSPISRELFSVDRISKKNPFAVEYNALNIEICLIYDVLKSLNYNILLFCITRYYYYLLLCIRSCIFYRSSINFAFEAAKISSI